MGSKRAQGPNTKVRTGAPAGPAAKRQPRVCTVPRGVPARVSRQNRPAARPSLRQRKVRSPRTFSAALRRLPRLPSGFRPVVYGRFWALLNELFRPLSSGLPKQEQRAVTPGGESPLKRAEGKKQGGQRSLPAVNDRPNSPAAPGKPRERGFGLRASGFAMRHLPIPECANSRDRQSCLSNGAGLRPAYLGRHPTSGWPVFRRSAATSGPFAHSRSVSPGI
jgi:hypothetical protein